MIEKALISEKIKESTKNVLRNYSKSCEDVDSLIEEVINSIKNSDDSKFLDDINVRVHYLINSKLSPDKDKQSLKAAIFSAKNEDPINKYDVAEVLGYFVKWKSLEHLEYLLTQDLPDFSKYTDEQILDYVKKELKGTPRIGKKRISNFRKEGNEILSRRIIDHIFKHKK